MNKDVRSTKTRRPFFFCFKVQQFLKTLEYDLERGVGSRLDSLLGQCMYFGLSFSRVGADFRGLLPPLFHMAAMKAFSTAVLDATERCVVFACVESSYEKDPDFPSLCFIISSLVAIFGYVVFEQYVPGIQQFYLLLL